MSSKSMNAAETLAHCERMDSEKKKKNLANKIANENRVDRLTSQSDTATYSLPSKKYSDNYDKIDWSK